MRKLALSILGLVFFGATTNAQIEVGSNGYVGIGISGTVNSPLSVNTVGSSTITGYFHSTNTGSSYKAIYGKIDAPAGGHWQYGIYGNCVPGYGYAVGVKGYTYSSSYSSSMTFGVYAQAGNGLDNYNYGVYGEILGSRNGAGIYGTTNGVKATSGIYAGYFYGTTKVNGTLWVGSTSYTSDKNAKKDIKDLEKGNIAKLKKIKAVKYKYKTPKELGFAESDTANTTINEEMQIYYNTTRIGLLAQEVEAVYPELVSADQQGYLGVNYDGLIPVLIEALKEQQVTIDELNYEIAKIKDNSNQKSGSTFITTENNIEQNHPNPFTQSTTINYTISNEATSAMLCIYDLNGTQLKCYQINQTGSGTQVINANELTPGMYLYSLIVNGQLVDTKRMVLTE